MAGLSATATQKGYELQFDEQLHKYTVGGKELESVTTWIGRHFFIPFNEGNTKFFAATNKAKSNEKKGKGITDKNLLIHYWNLNGSRAANIGTAAHIYFEMLHIMRTNNDDVPAMNGNELAVRRFYDKITPHFTIIECEGKVHSEEYLLAGSYDIRARHNESGEEYLFDLKTFDDHTKTERTRNEGTTMFGKTGNKLDKAAIQLALYNELGGFNIPPERRYVIQIKSDGEYVKHGGPTNPLTDVDAIMKQALETRKQAVRNTPGGEAAAVKDIF